MRVRVFLRGFFSGSFCHVHVHQLGKRKGGEESGSAGPAAATAAPPQENSVGIGSKKQRVDVWDEIASGGKHSSRGGAEADRAEEISMDLAEKDVQVLLFFQCKNECRCTLKVIVPGVGCGRGKEIRLFNTER